MFYTNIIFANLYLPRQKMENFHLNKIRMSSLPPKSIKLSQSTVKSEILQIIYPSNNNFTFILFARTYLFSIAEYTSYSDYPGLQWPRHMDIPLNWPNWSPKLVLSKVSCQILRWFVGHQIRVKQISSLSVDHSDPFKRRKQNLR